MSAFRLLIREILHRKLNFLLGLVAVVLAVGISVAIVNTSTAARRETIRLMRNLGFNVLILPEGTDLSDFWGRDFAREEMPEEYVDRLANSEIVSIRHLVARLQKRVDLHGRPVLLTGILRKKQPAHRVQKKHMAEFISRGNVYVGYQVARSLQWKVGDTIAIEGKNFTVKKCLPERGSKDDIRIYGHLHDVQEVLGKKGRINEMEALHCLCRRDSLATVRRDIASVLPGTYVTEYRTIAVARAETRQMVERYALFILPGILVVCVVWVGLLSLMNVRERRREIGVLRALGVNSPQVAFLFLGRAVLLGVLGAALGFGVGTYLALHLGPRIFHVTADKITPMFRLLGYGVVVAPVVCAVAAYLPAVIAVREDPAEVLREE